ncbi:MAG: phage tail protein [Oscillospiraceae bacterium]|nr:phage tail protein [Oscillospiraceae bacterium]
MAIVGSLGDIVFSVSPKQVKTFDNMQWSSSMRYATHNRHLKDLVRAKRRE